MKHTPVKTTIIFGVNPVRELLRAKQRTVYQVFVAKPLPKAWHELEKLVPRHVPITPLPREELSQKAGTVDHQGIVALVGKLPVRTKCFDPHKQPCIVLLDGIQDARNMGAIIRSASCLSIDGIVIPERGSAPLEGVVAKASAGLIEYIPIYQPASSAVAIQEIKAAGYGVYLATCKGADVRTVSFTTPLCVVIGSEGTGISDALLKKGTPITIPQRSSDISYNASVAAGIIFYTISSLLKRI
jgi:23S rRNA (guanosine2251-2'-O)-methyltransferase